MSKILLGYLFVFFHIKLNGFDILADFVGYFFIWQGLCTYDVPRFVQARMWALVLGLCSLLGIFGGRIFSSAPLSAFANLLTVGLSLYLLWLIGRGMGELEAVHEHPLCADELRRVWKVQAGANISAILLGYIPSAVAATLSVAVLLVALAANILFLIHIYKAKKILEELGAQ